MFVELAIVLLCSTGVKQATEKKQKTLTSPKLPSVALEQASNTDERTCGIFVETNYAIHCCCSNTLLGISLLVWFSCKYYVLSLKTLKMQMNKMNSWTALYIGLKFVIQSTATVKLM